VVDSKRPGTLRKCSVHVRVALEPAGPSISAVVTENAGAAPTRDTETAAARRAEHAHARTALRSPDAEAVRAGAVVEPAPAEEFAPGAVEAITPNTFTPTN